MSASPDRPVEMPWIIVGYGRVGQSLTLLAEQLGADVAATWNRTRSAAETAAVASPAPHCGELPEALDTIPDEPCLVWLTVVDDAISAVFDDVRARLPDHSVVVHTSGSLPSTILDAGDHICVASLHPLQAISDPVSAADRFSRSFWTIEGDDRAVELIEALLAPAGIEPTRIDSEHKTLYHASAVTAANLMVSLFDAAITMARAADIDEPTARQMLVELGKSSLENLADNPPDEALTGPASRGDVDVIERHRQALRRCEDPTLLKIYNVLTRRALTRLVD